MMQFLAALFVCFVVCVHPARLLSSFVPNFRCREVGIRSIAGDGKKNRVLNSVRLKLLDQKEKAETEECKSESDGKQKGTVGTEKEEAKDEPLWKRTVRAWKVYQDGRKQNARLLYEKLSGNSITEEIEDREVQKLTARFMADNMQNKTATDLYFKETFDPKGREEFVKEVGGQLSTSLVGALNLAIFIAVIRNVGVRLLTLKGASGGTSGLLEEFGVPDLSVLSPLLGELGGGDFSEKVLAVFTVVQVERLLLLTTFFPFGAFASYLSPFLFGGFLPGLFVMNVILSVSALTNFVLGKFFLKDFVREKFVKDAEWFEKINTKVQSPLEAFKVALLFRLAPLLPIPFDAHWYVLGVTDIAPQYFFAAFFLGSLKTTLLDGLIGNSLIAPALGLDPAHPPPRDPSKPPALTVLGRKFLDWLATQRNEWEAQKIDFLGPTAYDSVLLGKAGVTFDLHELVRNEQVMKFLADRQALEQTPVPVLLDKAAGGAAEAGMIAAGAGAGAAAAADGVAMSAQSALSSLSQNAEFIATVEISFLLLAQILVSNFATQTVVSLFLSVNEKDESESGSGCAEKGEDSEQILELQSLPQKDRQEQEQRQS